MTTDHKDETRLLGIVLAAGRGTRMGGPKALLRVAGRALAEQHATRLLEVGCREVLIVAPPEVCDALEEELRTAVPLQRAKICVIPASTTEQAESLQVALERAGERHLGFLPSKDTLLLITPVDLFPARVSTIFALISAVRDANEEVDAATPIFEGRGGHPVVLRASAARQDASLPLRERLHALGERRHRVPVEDPLILGDFDFPTDLERALRERASEPRDLESLGHGAHLDELGDD